MGKQSNNPNQTVPAGDRAGGMMDTVRKQGMKGPAPVHLWDPPYCGEMDLLIRADGTWIHEGSPIGRPEMVRMFSNILKYENGRHYIVTPVEKIGIQVEDAPFIAVDVEICKVVIFLTNVGDDVSLDRDHRLIMAGTEENPRPYVQVRGGLLARIDRKSFYRLAEAAVPGPDGRLGIRSAGEFHELEPETWHVSPQI
ncbi:DUF1285 domain-containing protein [Paracoccus aerodenitrificans]|uniref:DUF1285 domain-containing protein n=1 Tax=Paracoccus aerodenitrificans TaxID=3017781 RepID=UPI0022F0B66C|nr:DUF1285 domain-containing protein [Paracoccus aerodenitrificans]WBU65433.1 DUF1285 domain-containing protein [Paracoccus aerodenitrificans]